MPIRYTRATAIHKGRLMNREFYQANGYLSDLEITPPDEIGAIRAQFDALEAEVGRERARIGLLDRHFDTEFIWRLAAHPVVLDVVEELIGANFHLLATHFFCKYGREEKFVAWHQDVMYWGLEPPSALTVWYAIDDSDKENGCMRVIPGTHAGLRQHGKSEQAGNLLSVNQEIPVTEEEERSAVDLELRAGRASVHDGALIHGSLPNRSDRRRCGLTLRYVPTSVRQTEANATGKRWKPVLMRGEDKEKHFATEPAPFPFQR